MEKVRASINAPAFVGGSYPVNDAEIHVYFDFPSGDKHDRYRIQWVESERNLMVGRHQDETHPELGECYLQVNYEGETVHRSGVVSRCPPVERLRRESERASRFA